MTAQKRIRTSAKGWKADIRSSRRHDAYAPNADIPKDLRTAHEAAAQVPRWQEGTTIQPLRRLG
jgi:hypothetical protein